MREECEAFDRALADLKRAALWVAAAVATVLIIWIPAVFAWASLPIVIGLMIWMRRDWKQREAQSLDRARQEQAAFEERERHRAESVEADRADPDLEGRRTNRVTSDADLKAMLCASGVEFGPEATVVLPSGKTWRPGPGVER